MNGNVIADLAKLFLRRLSTGDFQKQNTSVAERAQLAAATPPVTTPLAQDYAGWRRAGLWISGVLLAVGAVLAMVEYEPIASALARSGLKAQGAPTTSENIKQAVTAIEAQVGKENISLLEGLQGSFLLIEVAMSALTLFAARAWANLARSRRMSLWAFVISLGVPLLLAAIPWTRLMDFHHLNDQVDRFARNQGIDAPALGEDAVKQMLAGLLAVGFVVMLLPKLLSLFPGVLRSSMTLKTLLPESTIPGWAVIGFSPLYAIFLLILLSVINQEQSSMILTAAVVALTTAPCLYLVNARHVLRSHTAEEVTGIVHDVRAKVGMCNGLGILLLVIYLVDVKEIGAVSKLHLLFEAAGSMLLTMVVFSDIALPLLGLDFRQDRALQGSKMAETLANRMTDLEASGLLDVKAALQLRGKGAGPSPTPTPGTWNP